MSSFATEGECTGNVRSTPTPKEILRAVNVSRSPPPCRRITTPWNTWMRSRPASTTRACTLTVSPGRKSGRSSRRRGFSTRSTLFIAKRSRDGFPMIAPGLGEPGSVPRVGSQQVRAVALGLGASGLPSPPLHRRVVPRDQDLRDLHAPELPGPSVVGMVEQALLERLERQGLLADHDPRHQTRDRLEPGERAARAAGEHVVADGDLLRRQPLDDALVHALVPAA